MDRKVMLSTVDNPFNPFTQWDEWLGFDLAHGYNCMGMLARIAITSDELSEADYNVAVAYAIDEIVAINVTGMYIRVDEPILNLDST